VSWGDSALSNGISRRFGFLIYLAESKAIITSL
jgi:hypothetical protein